MAIVAEVPYHVAHAACRTATMELQPYRKRFGGSTTLAISDLVMSRLAVKFERHNVRKNGPILRLHTLVQRFKPDTTYLVRVPGHIMTVRNNAVIDQQKHLNYLLCKNSKVTHWYEILGKGW